MQKTPIYARCHECGEIKPSQATCDVMRYGRLVTDHFCAEHLFIAAKALPLVSSIAAEALKLQEIANQKPEVEKKRSRAKRARLAGKSKQFLTSEELIECNVSLEMVVAEAMQGGKEMFRASISRKIAEVWGGCLPSLKMGNALARLVEKEVVSCSQEGSQLFTYRLTGKAFPLQKRPEKIPKRFLGAREISNLGKTARSIVLEMMTEDPLLRMVINGKIAQKYGGYLPSALFTKALNKLVDEGLAERSHEIHSFYVRTTLGSEWARAHCNTEESLAEEEKPDTISQPLGEANALPSRAQTRLQPVTNRAFSGSGVACHPQIQSVYS